MEACPSKVSVKSRQQKTASSAPALPLVSAETLAAQSPRHSGVPAEQCPRYPRTWEQSRRVATALRPGIRKSTCPRL